MHTVDKRSELRNGDGIHLLESMTCVSEDLNSGSPSGRLPSEDLQRLRAMHQDMLEATQTLQLIAQIRDLKVERYQLFVQFLAQREGMDLARQEIRFSDGAIVPIVQGK